MKNSILSVKFRDGSVFRGVDPGGVVDKMRWASPFTAGQSRLQYMIGYAQRYWKFKRKMFPPFFSTTSFIVALAGTDEIQSISIKEKNDR